MGHVHVERDPTIDWRASRQMAMQARKTKAKNPPLSDEELAGLTFRFEGSAGTMCYPPLPNPMEAFLQCYERGIDRRCEFKVG